jgi:phosphohistidine phosphatase SixA
MIPPALRNRLALLAVWIAWWLGLGFAASLASAAKGEPDPAVALSGAQLVHALQGGGFVIYFRHADTGTPSAEGSEVDLKRCETQRNLNDHGRNEARSIGAEFDRLRIPVGEVLTSEFCRCWQTAELAFGRYRMLSTLTGVSRNPEAAEKRSQAAGGLRELLAARPPAGTNTILVSHGYNLLDLEQFLLGTQGEAAIYRPDGHGGYALVARLVPAQWAAQPGGPH